MGDNEEKRYNNIYIAGKRGDEPCYSAEASKGFTGIDTYT